MCYVVRILLFAILLRSTVAARHASIDPAVRAARGLPEDIIRLCVGIEDSRDLLDDLEHALIDADAIMFSASENRYKCIPHVGAEDALSRAVEGLILQDDFQRREQKEWFVSAPGKVILFGEHAVVHGVVSAFHVSQGQG